MAKWKKVDMGSYAPTIEDMEAYVWCIRNKIYISPFATGEATWYLDIEINKKTNRSPTAYSKNTIWIKMYEFYKYYYDKYEK